MALDLVDKRLRNFIKNFEALQLNQFLTSEAEIEMQESLHVLLVEVAANIFLGVLPGPSGATSLFFPMQCSRPKFRLQHYPLTRLAHLFSV